jgi:hypothetical protein
MKKYLLLIVACILTVTANAQFKATKDGIATVDGSKYYVVQIPGKNAHELYNSANAYVITHYNLAKDVMSKIDDEMISIHCTSLISCNSSSKDYHPSTFVEMHFVIYFKDGKIRIDPPMIGKMTYAYKGNAYNAYLSGDEESIFDVSLFDKTGNPNKKQETFINALNDFINNKVNDIANYIKSGDNNNW